MILAGPIHLWHTFARRLFQRAWRRIQTLHLIDVAWHVFRVEPLGEAAMDDEWTIFEVASEGESIPAGFAQTSVSPAGNGESQPPGILIAGLMEVRKVAVLIEPVSQDQ